MTDKQFLILEASAGSGKTFALALRYVYLLLEGANMGEILALTFTNKAVEEMRQRIGDFLSLLGGYDENQVSKRDELLDALEAEYGWQRERVLALAPSLLEDYWRYGARILTLDAFFNMILKRFCWYAGVPYQFQIRDLDSSEVEERFVRSLSPKEQSEILALCLHTHRELNDFFERIEKIRVRFMDAVDEDGGVRVGIEECEKRAMEEAYKIQELIRSLPQLSQKAQNAVDFSNFKELLKKGERWIVAGSQFTFFRKANLDEDLFESLRCLVIEALEKREQVMLGLLSGIVWKYQASRDDEIRQKNILSFSDVMLKAFDLLCKNQISREFFYFRLDEKISHILLDEFQDTSVMQYKILFPLIEEILSGDGRIGNRSFFAVGDKKQSIYQFRGGCGELLDVLKRLSSEVCVENLEVNYRSCAEIVEFVNEVFAPHIKDYLPQKSHKKGGYVRIWDTQEIGEDYDDLDVFACVKVAIDDLLAQGVLLDEIAILAFTNADVMRLGDYLKEFFSPISTKESIALSLKRDAQILLGSLRYSQNPSELERVRLVKLLGGELEDDVELLPFEGGDLGSYIYRAIEFYGLNSRVAKQVLELACMSDGIQDFFERVEGSRDAQEEQKGLKILTIHASKGLEFEHLIVLDRLSGSHQREDLFFCQYDEKLEGRLFVTDSMRAKIDPMYKRILDQEREKKQEEKKNLLYVALTRACKSLHIMPICKNKAKSEFECIGLVEGMQVLVAQIRGEILPSHQIKGSGEKSEIFVHQESFGSQEGFIQKEQSKMIFKNIALLKRGEAFHKALELFLGYLAKNSELRHFLKNIYGIWLSDLQIEEILDSLDQIKTLLNLNFGSTQIKSEVSFIQDFKLYRIDCLLLCSNLDGELQRVVVLDYKSGLKKDEHIRQVQTYVDFVKSQYVDLVVEGYLLYLNQCELVQI
ncbi:RecB-like helicase [Helicobacter pametensis]|uniref:RecB-like helicase n=1 Tax=Helicobacter pametensis TaxID=95149 RepID=UPI0004853F73|nr:RecB-like helicase [Helicobacter pametensis]